MKQVDEKAFGHRFSCDLCYNVPDQFGRRIHVSQETPGSEQRGVEVVPKDERTVGFWGLFVIWGGFSIIMTNFLLGRYPSKGLLGPLP